MKILLGKPKIEITGLLNTGYPDDDNWVEVDTPKEDTTSLETTEGTDIEATEEGGEVVDRIAASSSYALSFELYKKKGETFPLAEHDFRGIVSGNYAIRVTSAVDDNAPGYLIENTSVKTAMLHAPNDALRKKFTFSALKAKTGETVKVIESNSLEFTKAADQTGKTVALPETDMTASVPTAATWITATVAGSTLTVKVTANSETSAPARSAVVSVRGFSSVVLVKVTQAANV